MNQIVVPVDLEVDRVGADVVVVADLPLLEGHAVGLKLDDPVVGRDEKPDRAVGLRDDAHSGHGVGVLGREQRRRSGPASRPSWSGRRATSPWKSPRNPMRAEENRAADPRHRSNANALLRAGIPEASSALS